jgi:hypothetical protein
LENVRQSIGLIQALGGRAEREALLFTLRDVAVLIIVVAVILWLAYELGRRNRG